MEMPKQKKILMPRGAIQKKAEWSGTRGSYLTHIPNLSRDTLEEIEVVPIREPYTYSRVVYDHDRSEYVYEVWEPQLNADEKEFLDMIKDSLNRTLEYEWDKMAEKDKKEYLQEAVDSFIKSRGLRLAPASKDKIVYYIIRDFVGYGPVDVLMSDLRIEDVSCDGIGIPLFIFHQKFESIKTSVIFDDEDALNSFTVMLGQRCGKQISVANPILDGTSVEGHRVQATYSKEVTTRGSSFTIRRYKEKPFTPVELVKFGTASAEMVAYLWVAVENGKSMMVCGGTASGKTATLNSAALFIRPGAKIVSIEDTREINLPHENWIPGTTRSGVGERGADGKAGGEIDMYDLVRAALRQRPNYIVVGEVRGKETYTMFQAMATGHPTMSTMHADSVKSMVNRLENPPINTPRILLTALNFVVIQTHARIGDSIVRRIKQVVELVGFEPETNELITNTVYEWDAATDTFVYKGHSFLFDEIMEMRNMTHEESEAGVGEPVPEGTGRMAHVREVRPSPRAPRPRARGQPAEGPHQAAAGGVSRGRLDEHDLRRGRLRRRGLRTRPLPVHPANRHFLPPDLPGPRGRPADLLLLHALLRPPGRTQGEAAIHGEEAGHEDRQADLRRDVVHLRHGVRRRPGGRDLQGALQADRLRRGRPRGGMDHPRHRAPRPGHPERDPEGGAAFPFQQVPGLPAGRRHDVHERGSAQAVLPRQGGTVREGGPPRDAEEDGDARHARRVLRDGRRGLPAFPGRDHGDHGPHQQGKLGQRTRAPLRGGRPDDPPQPVRLHLRDLEHGTGGQ